MLNSCVNGYNGFSSATTKIKASESKHVIEALDKKKYFTAALR